MEISEKMGNRIKVVIMGLESPMEQKINTLTLVKTTKNVVFGGYTEAPYTFSNSQTNAIEINHLSGINKKIENSNKKLSRKNDVRLINNSARMHSNEGVKIDYNLFNK